MIKGKNTALKLRGHERRTFMAGVVELLGLGGQRFAEEILGWNRKTIRKGRMELDLGIKLPDCYYSGRPRTEETLPFLLSDIESIISPQSQTDPTFRSKRVYSPITAPEILRRLDIVVSLAGGLFKEHTCQRELTQFD